MTYMPAGGERTLNCVHEWEIVAWSPMTTDPDPFVELFCPRCTFVKGGRQSDATPKPPPDPPETWQGITLGTEVRGHWREREGAFWRAGVLAAKGAE